MKIELHTRSRPAAGANTRSPGDNQVAPIGAETLSTRRPPALLARILVVARAMTLVMTIVMTSVGCSPSPTSEPGHAHDDHGHEEHGHHESFEGRTRIAPDVAERSNIVTAPAGPATIRERHEAFGVLTPIEGRHARIGARFDGLVKAVDAGVGEAVREGQRLALIESNQGLSEYPLIAPLDGVVLTRNIEAGEVVSSGAVVFEVADLRELWVDLHVFGVDADRLEPGLPLQVSDIARDKSVETHIQRVLPTTATASQSTIARGVLDNADGRWRPGAAILAEVTLSEIPVELAVPLDALQTLRDRDVVFERVGDEYEARPVDLGRRDGRHVEVLAGLRQGAEVVIGQSYLIKADIEKAGVTHAH